LGKRALFLLSVSAVLAMAAAMLSAQEEMAEKKPKSSQEYVEAAKFLGGLFPFGPLPHFFLARAYMYEGQPGKAEEEIKKGLEIHPSATYGQILMGELHYSRGQWVKAEEQFKAALKKLPNDYTCNLRLGEIETRLGRAEEAEKYLAKALEARPNDFAALFQLGRLYALRPETASRAISTLKGVYQQKPDDLDLNLLLGRLSFESKQYAEASYFYSKCVTLKSGSHEYRLAYGKSLYYEGKHDEAFDQLRRAAKGEPRNPEPHYYMGGVLLAQKKYPRAAAAFLKANRLQKNYKDTLFFLGKVEYLQGLYNKAFSKLLQYRIAHLTEGTGDPAAQSEAMDLMLEMEKLAGITRRPNQIPGKIDPEYMAVIPAGTFHYGGDIGADKKEGLSLDVKLNVYAIDKTEVSNADYKVFVQATDRPVPASDADVGPANRFNWNRASKSFPEGMENLPVVNVSWEDAVAYAAWAGKRLPTEAEWERAARGGLKGESYPWGRRPPTKEQSCFAADGPRSVSDAEPNGFGIRHMAGNAAEWCSDWFEQDLQTAAGAGENPKGPQAGMLRSYRGGHWQNAAEDLRVARRAGLSPKSCTPYVGFRCAAAAEAGK
jgi:sulfatase modifying factor 1